MERGPGIQREATGFILLMLVIVHLSLEWTTPGRLYVGYSIPPDKAVRDAARKTKHKPGVRAVTVRHAVQKATLPPAGPAGEAASRAESIGKAVREGLVNCFAARGTSYPPGRVTFIAVKEERRLEVWAEGGDGVRRYIMDYPICATSGRTGPKLRRGDNQVPEGVYSIVGMNPYSKYHLSLKINYPNGFDRLMAEYDGRTDLGGNIFIHGNCVSEGCIAMGDAAIEEIYVLIKDTGLGNSSVIIAPWDFRKQGPKGASPQGLPEWTPVLYDRIKSAMLVYEFAGR